MTRTLPSRTQLLNVLFHKIQKIHVFIMLLSPLATPFQPAYGSQTGVVFNDGVPCMVGSDHDIIRGYQDAVLDENFPDDDPPVDIDPLPPEDDRLIL